MRLSKREIAKSLLKIIAIGLASGYLTFIVDVYTLNTDLKRLFVFGYFFVMCVFCDRLIKRFFPGKHDSKRVLLSFVFAAAILASYQDFFLSRVQETAISLRADINSEVWLVDLEIDGQRVPLSQIQVAENSGWLYHEEYDDFIFYPGENQGENCLTLQFIAKEVKLIFADWSGGVSIESPTGDKMELNLYRNEESYDVESQRVTVPIDFRHSYTISERLAYNIGAMLILSFLLLLLRDVVVRMVQRQFDEKIFVLFFINFFLLFFTSRQIAPDTLTKIMLAILSASSILCLQSEKAQELIKKYRTTGKLAAIILVAIYSSLASFGQRFFLDGNTRMHFSAFGLLYIVLGTVWFIPIIYLLLYGLERLSALCRPRAETSHRRRVFFALLGIMCVCQAVILWAFQPGGFPPDCIDQLEQAVGNRSLSDWHPVLNALFYRGVCAIIPNIAAITGVQMFLFALLFVQFLMLGYDNGIPFSCLAIVGCIFVLLPNQVFFEILTEKDCPYMLSLLWGTYLLIRMGVDPLAHKRWTFLLAIVVDLFCIIGFRHNGVVPFAAILLWLLWITITRFSQVKFRLITVGIAVVLLVDLYRGPVFTRLDVGANTVSPYSTMLFAVGSCVNKDLPLSEETNDILETIIPLEQWGDYYDRYLGHDHYYWDRGDLGIADPYDTTHLTGREAFSIYFDALSRYPDVVIKDRLDGMDILWDVSQPYDSFNIKANDAVWAIYSEDVAKYIYTDSLNLEGEAYYNRSALAEAYRKALYTGTNNAFDMLLWRTGSYMILLLVLCLFWWENRMKDIFWAAFPLLGNILGLILVLYHQSFRYVYPVQILTVVLAFCSICMKNQGHKFCNLSGLDRSTHSRTHNKDTHL